MIIGIHSIAAFKKQRTGVEEYTFQLIRHLAMLPEAREHRFLLYTFYNQKSEIYNLPDNFEIRILRSPLLWTQFRLSLEMLKKECDVFFIPAHVLPIIHSKNSVVAIHGLEYEYFPEYYPFWFKKYLRWATKYSVRRAKKIIAVSENTKKDLVKFYGIDEKKIKVIYHGAEKLEILNSKSETNTKYILYIGRIELKKNIVGIIKAFEIFKEKYKLPHKLVLVGLPGFGYKDTKYHIQNNKYKNDIVETGYLNEKEALFQNA